MTTTNDNRPIILEREVYRCAPFDNSGHFECKADADGTARWAVHKWTHPTSHRVGFFCPRHSPFDYTDRETGECIAWDRDKTDACERGTPGCSIHHTGNTSCQTW